MSTNFQIMKQSVSSPRAVEDNLKHISAKQIDFSSLVDQFEDDAAGAVVIFNGTVRKLSLGKQVDHLFYEAAIAMAEKMVDQLLLEAKERWNLSSVFAVHRIGAVRVGERAVVVVTASPHRKEAYEANRYLIEKIKHELPLWKCEYFIDGTKKWGGNCSCQEVTGDPNVHIYES